MAPTKAGPVEGESARVVRRRAARAAVGSGVGLVRAGWVGGDKRDKRRPRTMLAPRLARFPCTAAARSFSHARDVLCTTSSVSGTLVVCNQGTATLDCSDASEQAPATAFTPKELLYASLSSCTLATLRHYIAAALTTQPAWSTVKGLSARVVEVMGEDKHIPNALQLFVYIETTTNHPAQMVERLRRAADFCPVKRMLHPQINITMNIELLKKQ